MATKANKKTSSSDGASDLMKAKALEKLTEHNRDYFKLDLTLPLGNKALKSVHTNQWLFTNLPKEFDLANWTVIAEAINAKSNRFSGYVENRWYIEANDITVDIESNKAEMKLGLNAFPSSYENYVKGYKDSVDAYNNTTSKSSSSDSSSGDKNTTNAVSSGKNSTVKNGWWGKWVTEMVRKNVGNETDVLKKCKKMYQVFCDHTVYSLYYNARYTHSGVNSYESVWKSGKWLNCGDGANILTAFMAACGANPTILNGSGCGYGHYVVKVVIGKNTYWCDHAANTGQHTTRGWNNTFCDIRSGSSEGTHINYA